MSPSRFDLVIFGATGYTGKNTIPQVDKLSKANGRNLTWAVAGRSESKLKAVLEEMGKKMEKDLSSIPMIIADVGDAESLEKMTEKAKAIINTCGPYKFYGEPVIEACLKTGTHHVDVSGEPLFIESMEYKYNKQAQEKGIYIISACGFDSIPADIGLLFLEEKFEGTLNSVETYLNSKQVGEQKPGARINYGTWESAVHGVSNATELKEIRSKLYPNKLPRLSPRLALRGFLHTCPFNNAWALHFLGSDRSVMQRTQRFLYEEKKMRPVQIGTYFCLESLLHVIMFAIMGGIFMLLTKFDFGKNLLLKHPKFFSLGMFSHEGPTDEVCKTTKFNTILIGRGWSEKTEDPNREFQSKPDKKMIAKVSGTNPGYGATTMALTVSAITILEQKDKMPKNGGVYSPGAAFKDTSIIKELHENGLTFEIVSDEN